VAAVPQEDLKRVAENEHKRKEHSANYIRYMDHELDVMPVTTSPINSAVT